MSEVAVVEVPQWQGSGSATARRLREGARLLAGLVPAAQHVWVEASDETGARVLAETAGKVRKALDRTQGRLTVTVGGDCGVDLEPIAAARRRHGDRLTVIWFDAHGDLNTPASSPSGAFHGMVLRTLLGEGPPDLIPDEPLRREQVVLAGVRSLDPAERAFVEGVGSVTGPAEPAFTEGAESGTGPDGRAYAGRLANVTGPAALVEAVGDADAVYVHLDLDVLDPGVFASVGTPEPGGLTPAQVIEMVTALATRYEIAGVGITEYEPARAEDQEILTGLVDAVVSVSEASLIREVERRAFAAWPAGLVREEAGWRLRHTPGVRRRRSNSAVPPPDGEAGASLDQVEAFYRERDRPPMIQLGGPAHHELDALLAERGYRVDAPTSVLTARTADVIAATAPATHPHRAAAKLGSAAHLSESATPSGPAAPAGSAVRLPGAPAPPRSATPPGAAVHLPGSAAHPRGSVASFGSVGSVELEEHPDSWLRTFAALDGHVDSEAVGELVISRITAPVAFVRVGLDAGMGLFVGDSGWAGIFAMATRPDLRGQGVATAVLGAGARWAAGLGLSRLYLQVEDGNEAALRLYTRAGFSRSYGYHYRVGG